MLAEIHISMRNPQAAQELIDRSVARVMTTGNVISKANLHVVWAKCLLSGNFILSIRFILTEHLDKNRDLTKVISHLNEALQFARTLNDKQTLTDIFNDFETVKNVDWRRDLLLASNSLR